jgi:hypothetical protein
MVVTLKHTVQDLTPGSFIVSKLVKLCPTEDSNSYPPDQAQGALPKSYLAGERLSGPRQDSLQHHITANLSDHFHVRRNGRCSNVWRAPWEKPETYNLCNIISTRHVHTHTKQCRHLGPKDYTGQGFKGQGWGLGAVHWRYRHHTQSAIVPCIMCFRNALIKWTRDNDFCIFFHDRKQLLSNKGFKF